MRQALAAVLALYASFGALMPNAGAADGDCRPANNLTYVLGVDECLALQTFAPADGAAAANAGRVLVVVLHGDLSGGGTADYIFPLAERAAEAGAVGVAMMRLGYSGGGRSSTGTASRNEKRPQIYTADEMDEIAAAIRRLKDHHGAQQVAVIGHSGGAVMAGVILGRHPGLVQRAMLVSCPCDIPTWRKMRNRNPLPNAENPIDHIDRIPRGTVIRLVTGAGDTNTRPSLAADYAARAQAAGVDAVAAEVPGEGHNLSAGMAANAEFQAAFKQVVVGR